MARPLKTVKLNGIRYTVELDKVMDGYVELPGEPETRILHVNKDLGPRDFLETLVHESLHASLPSEDEEQVTRVGREIAMFLWRLGYRRG